MVKRKEIAKGALEDMEIVSIADDSSTVEDIQENGNVCIQIMWFLFTHALTNSEVLF